MGPLCPCCSSSHFQSYPSLPSSAATVAARLALCFLPSGPRALLLRTGHVECREHSLCLRLLLHSSMSGARGSGAAAAAAGGAASSNAPLLAASLGLQASNSRDDGDGEPVSTGDILAVRARKTADATAAAESAAAEIVADAKGPYSKMHSSAQILLLNASELWDTISVNWCKPGAEMIVDIVETWEGRDLAACVWKLGLPVLYPKRNYAQHMRRSVVNAVRAYARDHPELFEPAPQVGAQSSDPESDTEEQAERKESASPPRAPRVDAIAQPQRRSPRDSASSRSLSAAAMAAINALPVLGPVATPPRVRQQQQRPLPKNSSAHVASARSSGPHVRADLRLFEAGTSPSTSSDEEDESDSDVDQDWLPENSAEIDPMDAALQRGRRPRREDVDHHLARAGVHRPFADGFIANARFAAGGRSMYQLYKEVTGSFTTESSKRECLALSRILDALLRGDVGAALEHTCRRLGGVHTAAETGNWAMCERLETEAEQRSFVPDAFMRSALRSVTQMQAVKKSAAENAVGKGPFRKAAQASGRGERSSAKSNNKKGSSTGREVNRDTGASTSHKKSGAGSDTK